MKKYCILGGGGSFGLHSAFYLLENVKLKKVIGVGRNFLREEPFSLNITQHENMNITLDTYIMNKIYYWNYLIKKNQK